jgi:acyl phosphate:glycerol-3-phosphate acyltransferase
MLQASLLLLGYLCGSVPFGVLVAWRLRGVDVRQRGSGNIGASNVARVAGRRLGVVVLLLDALKGALPVALARSLVPGDGALHAAVGLAAVLGHVFPVWLRLRGGKGVATALGVTAVLGPWAALAGATVYLALVLSFRMSSLGSLLGGCTAVAVAWATARSREAAVLVSFLFLLVLWTHRGNIRRLITRTERRV